MNKKSILLLTFLGMLAIVYIFSGTDTYFGRYIRWRNSDIEDYKKFPKYDFKASGNPYYFSKVNNPYFDTLRVTGQGTARSPLLEILRNSGTTAFIIIRNDTIYYEKYINGYARGSVNTSFSVAKSVTSLLIGKALDENLIKNVNDPVVTYIPGLLDTDKSYKNLLLSDVLDMRSGIRFRDHDLPWGDKPKAYYGPNLRERILELPLVEAPGQNFRYNSYNPILAGMILEKVTGMSPAAYFETKIWNEMGMEYPGSWSMDSEVSRMTKMESGLNIRPIDFAKLGRLVLHNGNWEGKQLISRNWMENTLALSDKYQLTDIADDLYYKNYWWIYANKSGSGYTVDIISANGHLGQYLFVFPKEKMIMVRMGMANWGVDSWKAIFLEIREGLSRIP